MHHASTRSAIGPGDLLMRHLVVVGIAIKQRSGESLHPAVVYVRTCNEVEEPS